jgi:ligand-binding sensor domain-containing protein/signal transduction histidine kinase
MPTVNPAGRLFAIAIVLVARGEAWSAIGPAELASPYAVDVWKAEEGLPQNSVQAILQTRDGYLWIGTQEGLVRFDGVRFTIHDVGNTASLRSNYIRALYEDRAGNLWIGTEGGGLSRYRDRTFTTYAIAEGLSHTTVTSIAEDRAGNLWVGTFGGGLNLLRAGGDHERPRISALTVDDGLASNLVRAIFKDSGGNLWIGTEGGGLNRMTDGVITTYAAEKGLTHGTVHAIHEDKSGSLWVGTGEGLYRFRDGRFSPYPTPNTRAGNTVYAIYEDREGSLWIGTGGGGLDRIEEGRISAFGAADGLSNGIVYSIEEDREGSLWIGTGGGGLNRLRHGAFSVLSTKEGLTNEQTSLIVEDREGSLWIGTWGGGLNRFTSKGHLAYTPANGLSSSIVSSVFEDTRGDLWIGTHGAGLNRLRDGTITVYDTTDGLANDTVWGMAEDPEGAVWIGTSGGLSRLKDGVFTNYTARDGLSNEMVRPIHSDCEGALWFGTNGGGLYRFENGRFVMYTTREGLASDLVYSLYEDREGVLWIGTGGGLSRLEHGTLTSFTKEDGLCESRVFQILEDESDNLWMSCNKGIFRVAKKDLAAFSRAKGGRIGCTLYGRAAGMRSSECSGGSQPAGWKARDGRLWFPTIDGAVVIDPERIRKNTLPPPVVIEEVFIDKKAAPAEAFAELPPGKGELEFRYAALSLLDPENVRFRYRLEGFESEWLDAGGRRTAYYTNIPPGSYRFRVIACNNEGVWNEAGASFAFRLRPHLYQTGWFYFLLALAVTLATYALYQVRVRHLKERETELARLVHERTKDLAEATRSLEESSRRQADFVSGVTHELKTPLTLIRLYGETLQYERGGTEEERSRYSEIITRECERLTQLVDRVLDFSRIDRGQKQYHLRAGDLAATVSGTVEAYGRVLARQGFSIETELPDALPAARFDPDAISVAVLNLMDNAAKYSGSSKAIHVRLYPRNGKFVLEVEDHGIGIPRGETGRIFEQFYRARDTGGTGGYGLGLFLVQHIMRAHAGDVEVESEVGLGSRFRLVLPGANDA